MGQPAGREGRWTVGEGPKQDDPSALEGEIERKGRQQLPDLAAAEDAFTAYARSWNHDRHRGGVDWQTPAQRFDGAPFTDRGFGRVPSLAGEADL